MINTFNNIKYFFVYICCLCLPFIGIAQTENETEEEEPTKEAPKVESRSAATDYLLQEQINLDYVNQDQLKALEELIKKNVEGESSDWTGNLGQRADLNDLLTLLFPPPPPPASEIYGHQIFRKDSIAIFDPTSISKVSDAYTLGVGDEITISIFGASQYDATFEIKAEGHIQPQAMQKIFLKGLSWGKAKKLLQNRFKVFYLFRAEQFSATLSKPRTVLVNILGEVEKPGSYSLIATNTAFNALIAAGGPTDKGSVRKIRVIRGRTIKEFDIYKLMADPSVQFDFPLEDNDIIQIPLAQKIVEIRGAVNRPFKYELTEDEGLKELVELTGGLSANAHKELIQINRFTDTERILLDLNWFDVERNSYSLQNGDEIIVKEIGAAITNSVLIEGAVELPGAYALPTTIRITDLLRKARIMPQARLDVAFLIRENADSTSQLIQLNLTDIINNVGSAVDLPLQGNDKLLIYKQNRFVDPSIVSVAGGVREKGTKIPFDPDSTITIQRAILLAGGLNPDAADIGYILRTNPDGSKIYLPIDLVEAMKIPENRANIKLHANDFLYVLEEKRFVDSLQVEIKGAVRFPIKLEYSPSLKLKDLLTIAGGLKREAALNRIEVFRLEVVGQPKSRCSVTTLTVDEQFNIINGGANFELMPYDEIVVRTIAEYAEPAIITVEGEVAYPGDYGLIKKNETLSSIIERAGGITVEAFLKGVTINRPIEGNILADLDEVLRKNNKTYDFLVRAGDVIQIPKIKDLVTIGLKNTRVQELGAGTGKIGVPYNAGKSAKWYIQEYAGGLGKKAARRNIFVQYANGRVKGSKKVLLFNKYPKPEVGATIIIAAKPEKKEKEPRKIFNRRSKSISLPVDFIEEAKPVEEKKEIIENN